MRDLYLLNYNNYENRKVKVENTLTKYLPYQLGRTLTNINFFSKDEVETIQTVNVDFDKLNGEPNYLLVVEAGGDTIISRWFIIDSNKIRVGQYELALYRDTLADYKASILGANAFIQKGTVAQTDKLIYNSENTQVNQIKTKETLLKDSTGIPWIVGYISPDVAIDNNNGEFIIQNYEQTDYDLNSIEDYPYYKYRVPTRTSKDSYLGISYIDTTQWPSPIGAIQQQAQIGFPLTGNYAGGGGAANTEFYVHHYSGFGGYRQAALEQWNMINAETKIAIEAANPSIDISREEYNDILENANTPIKTRYGTFHYEVKDDGWQSGTFIPHEFLSTIRSCFQNSNTGNPKADWTWGGQLNQESVRYCFHSFHLEFIEDTNDSRVKYKVKFRGADLYNQTTPYGVICMPYADNYTIMGGVAMTKEQRIKLFQALGTVKNLLYDVQILPYCPVEQIIIDGNNITQLKPEHQIKIFDADDVYTTSFIVADYTEFSFTIDVSIVVNDIKMANECQKWRLVSPNYASTWEFNAAKFYEGNAGVIRSFNVDCSYKPYSPYIHIAPDWSGLYGQGINEGEFDFWNDPRGLICAGDFSIDRLSDTWETYQYNNKNFQLAFDREVESLETARSWGRISDTLGAIGGALGGVRAGMAGGVKGAIIGGLSGSAGGIYNAIKNEALYQDQLDAKKDQFNYNLQNIQAQPFSLTKVSALNRNNKLFPILEFYDCSDRERQAFKDRMNFDGMTVGVIGHIIDFLNINSDGTYKYPLVDNKYNKNFIKARIIEFPSSLKQNAHTTKVINYELGRGVYFE